MKKSLTLTLAILLVIGIAIGGTIAWLTDDTDPVTNTFTTSDISITLDESDDLNLKMIPGHTIYKDPYVTVSAESENFYLFVEVTKSTNFDSYMTYAIADGWILLEDGVYYKEIDTAAEKGVDDEGNPIKHYVLKGNTVTVKDDVTKTMMNDLTEATYPTLSFKAYAIQMNNSNETTFGAANAWKEIKGLE